MAYNTSIIDALDELVVGKKTFNQDDALGQPRNMRLKEIRSHLSVMAARFISISDEWLARKVTSSHATPMSSRRGRARTCSWIAVKHQARDEQVEYAPR